MLQPVLKNITAQVDFVSPKCVRLTSNELVRGSYIHLSPVMASVLVPRLDVLDRTRPWDFESEYEIGDQMKLDVFADEEDEFHYVPLHIHTLIKRRHDGKHISAMGMIIDKTEFAGIVVRSCHVPIDIVCRATDFVFPPGCPISVGTIVSFEVVVSGHPGLRETRCCLVRVHPPTVNFAGFPYYVNGQGKVVRDATANAYKVQFHFDERIPRSFLPSNRELPIYEAALYNGCAPAMALVNEFVTCFICPRMPYLNLNSDFEVIKIEVPERSSAVPLNERRPSWTNDTDALHQAGKRQSERSTQCVKFFPDELAELMKEIFLFTVDHARSKPFTRLVTKKDHSGHLEFGHFVRVMLKDIGLAEVDGSSDEQPSSTT